jgi:hypothetical protein
MKTAAIWVSLTVAVAVLSAGISTAAPLSDAVVVLRNPHDVDRLTNGHTLITDGGDPSGAQSRVIEVDAAGNTTWSFAAGLDFAHSAERLPNGNTLISDTGHDRVIEVNPAGNIVWNSQNVTLSDGSHLNYPNDADWLSAGNHLLITDRDNHRALEIRRDGTVIWQFGVTGQPGSDATHLRGPHNADRLSNGNTLIADSSNNRILEVTPAGAIAWQYAPTGADHLDWPRDADRLDSRRSPLGDGNTLISKADTGHVIEVTPAGMIVWSYPPGLVDVNLPWSSQTLKVSQTFRVSSTPQTLKVSQTFRVSSTPQTLKVSQTFRVSSSQLVVRIQAPSPGAARYADGAPVIIWLSGGEECRDFKHGLPAEADDLVILTFLYPGCTDVVTGRASSGTYDWRGQESIRALRDVILYAAGELTDDLGRTIDQVVPVHVLHDNIGLIGASNGGNIIVAAAALHGADLTGHLRYLVQWETPVSSQIATRDLGRVWMKPYSAQGDYFNPRYLGYEPLTLAVSYSDLAYNAAEPFYPVFHDGGGLPPGAPPDGNYTTIPDEAGSPADPPDPDVDHSHALELDEDFPLDGYTGEDGVQRIYSRPVTQALADQHVFPHWPPTVATPAEAAAYWDIRESVRMYDDALAALPRLEGMVLASVRDHVQSAADKPHIRQAFEGWRNAGGWVQINPSRSYVLQVDPTLNPSWLPNNAPNTPPADWSDAAAYCIAEAVPDAVYQLAAVWQMADRAQRKPVYLPLMLK